MHYGRSNIFSSDNRGGSSYSGSHNDYRYNNRNSSQNAWDRDRDRDRIQKLGSHRLVYTENIDHHLMNTNIKWKETPPSCICLREETLHLHPVELRVEDYFMIRKNMINRETERDLKDAIYRGSFNEQILKYQFDRLPPVSNERPLDYDAIRGGRMNGDSSGGYGGGGGWGGSSRNNNGNIFSGGSGNNNSSNIFSRNNNSSSYNSYSYNSGNNNNNSSSGGYNGGNIFSRGNSSGNSGNSIFGNSNNNSSGNIFSRGNNNSGIFGNNNNNNSGNGIFGNNNKGNIFGNNNNNNNNIFGNNNNRGGNIFSNNNNNSGGNIFNNNNNNSTNQAMTQEMVNAFRCMFQENKIFMEKISKQLNLEQPEIKYQFKQESELSPFDNLREDSSRSDLDNFLSSGKKEKPNQTVVILKPEWYDQYKELARSKLEYSRVSDRIKNVPNKSQIMQENTFGLPNESRRMTNESKMMRNNLTRKTESFLNNHPRNEMMGSRLSRNTHKSNIYPNSQQKCKCHLILQIFWEDDSRKMMPKSNIDASLLIPNFRPQMQEWRQKLVIRLKENFPFVRKNAKLEQFQVRQKGENEFVIEGVIEQKIINVAEGYEATYSKIVNNKIFDLYISNSEGAVTWEVPIDAVTLDLCGRTEFFEIGPNLITCQLEVLDKPCRVIFYSLPQQMAQTFATDPDQAKRTFKEYLAGMSGGKFQLLQLWEKGWQMRVSSFPALEQIMDE